VVVGLVVSTPAFAISTPLLGGLYDFESAPFDAQLNGIIVAWRYR
jgi:hypothetical protein